MNKSGLAMFFCFLLFGVNVVAGVDFPLNPEACIASCQKINLNTADVETLTHSFKGIGRKRAEAIVAYRSQHGLFKRVDDLSKIRGLGVVFVRRHLLELSTIFSVGYG